MEMLALTFTISYYRNPIASLGKIVLVVASAASCRRDSVGSLKKKVKATKSQNVYGLEEPKFFASTDELSMNSTKLKKTWI